MKFQCGLSRKEKAAALTEWHRWFAWHPVRVGHRDCRWLEWVERRYLHAWLGELTPGILKTGVRYRPAGEGQ